MIEFFYDLCYILPLNLVAVLSLLTYLGNDEHSLLCCIVGSFVIIFERLLRYIGKKERIFISGIVIAALTGLYLVLGREKRTYFYDNYGFLLYVLIVAAVCVVAGKLIEEYVWVKIVFALLLIANAVILMVQRIAVSRAIIAGTLLILMIYVAGLIQKYWKKSGYTDFKSHIALTTPILLIVFTLVCVIPASENPFDWKFARDIWKSVVTECKRFSGMIGSKSDDYSFAGFSEESSFGTGLGSSDREVMIITTGSDAPDRLYLGGITFKDFTLKGWENDLNEEGNFGELDVIETRGAIIKYNEGYERDYFRESSILVESKLLNATHVFHPIKTNLGSKNTVLQEYKETEKSVQTLSNIRYGDSYCLRYYRMNFDNPDLIDLIDTAEALSKEDWDEMLRRVQVSDAESCAYEKYLLYKDEIKEKYGKTYGLSDEVTEIVENVTDGIEGDYERIKALSSYLQSMTYTSQPGALPSSIETPSDYLDYFLLESKKGYCVHYATALVLLARECGYPARYVQGYYAVTNGSKAEFTVTEKSAHSWAEVYFENFGWVAFEATPGYTLAKGWNVGKVVAATEQTGYMLHPEDNTPVEDKTPEEITEEPEKQVIPVRYFVMPILLAAFFGAAFMFVNRLITNSKYKKMSNSDKLDFLIQRKMRILKIMGYPILPYETIGEYFIRVSGELPEWTDCLSFILLYEKRLYSDYEAVDEDVIHTETEYAKLKEAFRKRGFRYKFYIV